MSDASKTTYNTLANNSSDSAIAGFNALVKTATPSHKADLQRRLTDAIRYSAPAIGDYWNGQGGIYAGIVRNGDRQWHLISADKLAGTFRDRWSANHQSLGVDFSLRDGLHNTRLILSAEPNNRLAKMIASLALGGHTDWYWPSHFENTLILTNTPEQISHNIYWSSTETSYADHAFSIAPTDGQHYSNKSNSFNAIAVRRVPIY